MEKMNDLRDLLKHEIMDLQSAEEQIIKAMPAMIAKARNPELKQSLQSHLKVTEAQLARLQQVQGLMMDADGNNNTKEEGLLSRLFKRNYVCRGMQGLIEEGEKVMNEDMSPEVLDAAIIASAQKIEHYEICGYGTARAFASELHLTEVAALLEQTLDEEYEADDRLTGLAVNRLNERAEKSGGTRGNGARSNGKTGTNTREGSRQRAARPAAEMEPAADKRGRHNEEAKTKGTARGAAENRTASKSSAASSRVNKSATKSAGTRGNNSSGRGSAPGRGDR